MRKSLGIIIVFWLFFAVLPMAQAAEVKPATELSAPQTASFAHPETKWELLSGMAKGILAPGSYTATFSEEEVNGVIDAELSTLKIRWFVDKASVKFNDGYGSISFHVLRPFKGDITADLTITAENGKAKIGVSSGYYGFFPVPASFVERIGNFVMKRRSPNEWLTLKNANWDYITFKDGELSFGITVPEQTQ